MSSHTPSSRPPRPTGQLPPWLIISLFAVIIIVSYWQTRSPSPVAPSDSEISRPTQTSSSTNATRRRTEVEEPADRSDGPTAARRVTSPIHRPIDADVTQEPDDPAPAEKSSATRIENQTIRDLNGRVVFRGTVDLEPTLIRIESAGQGSFRHDGTTFQNRERRLPAKASGYYREYVHPTPKLDGPGPQRVIVGRDGDVWYTPDHYKSFVRVR